MKSNAIIGVVMSFALAFALMSGSGLGPVIFGQDNDTGDSMGKPNSTLSEFESIAEEEKTTDVGLLGSLGTLGGNPIIGLILAFGDTAKALLGTVVLFPLYLTRLGFPSYFSYPVGVLCQVITTVGFFQVITGRELL